MVRILTGRVKVLRRGNSRRISGVFSRGLHQAKGNYSRKAKLTDPVRITGKKTIYYKPKK